MRITRINQSAIDDLMESPELVADLGEAAEGILTKARGRAPSWLDAQWLVRAGVGPNGAFAQAIARGSGAVIAEYGGSRSPAYSYMRSSIR